MGNCAECEGYTTNGLFDGGDCDPDLYSSSINYDSTTTIMPEDPLCQCHAQWSGDDVCDFDGCYKCDGFWDGVFDGGDCQDLPENQEQCASGYTCDYVRGQFTYGFEHYDSNADGVLSAGEENTEEYLFQLCD